MRHYSRSRGGQLRRTRRASAPAAAPVTALGLLLLADPLRIPYPILLVVGGLALGFAPGVPTVTLPPDVVLIGILPPLLYSAAFNTGLRDLKRNIRPISLLAIGLVTVTMVGVAVAAHYVIDLSWAAGFVLGAVVSPTDPIAATSIAHRLGVPRRAIAIVEGESLVNDGTALVLFKFAAAAVVAGSFSLVARCGRLRLDGRRRDRRRARDRPRDPLHPLPRRQPAARGDDRVPHRLHRVPARAALGVSGVLAVVTAGVYMGWHTPELTNVDTRLQGDGFWAIFSFLLNALLFGLVGLQLRPILDQLHGLSWQQLVGYAALALGRRARRQVRVWVPDRATSRAGCRAASASGIRRRRGSSSRSSAGPGCAAASRWPPRSRSRWRRTPELRSRTAR